jgi:hypothetical protein
MKIAIEVLRDALVFGGLATTGTGLWWLHPPSALIVMGCAMMALGILGRSR